MNDNTLTLEFPSVGPNLCVAKKTIEAFLFSTQNDTTDDEIHDICNAVGEAISNCIDHAYGDKIGKVFVTLSLEDKKFTAIIRDTGIGISDIEQAKTPLFTTTADGSGMGFTVMETYMDEVKVTSNLGNGTEITMERKLRIKV